MGTNISDTISVSKITNSELIGKWNGVIEVLIKRHVIKNIDITPVMAEKYKFDLAGLFSNELDMSQELIYPHIRINGYDASNTYDGKRLSLKILDATAVTNYHKLFTK